MNGRNVLVVKSFDFAVKIVELHKQIVKNHREFVMSKQILKSGTSVGANIEEAQGGYSKRDFKAKLGISYKEIRETKYWLKLLYKTEYISQYDFDSYFRDADELARLLYSIIKSTKD